ncbi:MAG TPA: hypothetical protein VMZ50_06310 [Phycisphaerae bacterium]|nr:hypothetical protein [Phycisphaerae bacterium]
MKVFLAKLAAFLAIQAAIAAVLVAHAREDDNDYIAATIEKHQRLEMLTQNGDPKVIFVGGSSMAFSMDCEIIEGELPHYRAVNMGIQATLGARFMLWEVLADLREGDVVVLGLEYEHYERDLTSHHLLRLIHVHPPNIRHVPWKQLPDMAFSYIGHVTHLGRRGLFGKTPRAEPPFLRRGFNEYGDVVVHHTLPPDRSDQPAEFLTGKGPPGYLDTMADAMNAFHRTCRRKGARVFLVAPPVREMDYRQCGADLDALFARLRRKTTIPILLAPDEAVYPSTLFFHAKYHLTREGARQRARKIALRLQRHLGIALTAPEADPP